MNKLTKQFFNANKHAMFRGCPQVMTIAYTKQNKDGQRKALRYLAKWAIEASKLSDWVTISNKQISELKSATKHLKSVQGFAVLTNETGCHEDWNVELIAGRI